MYVMTESYKGHIDGLVQEKLNSTANALELWLSCTDPSIYKPNVVKYDLK